MPSRPGGRERAGKTSGKTSKAQEDRPGNGTNADWHFSTAPDKMEVLSEQDVKRMMLPGARGREARFWPGSRYMWRGASACFFRR